MHKTLKKIEPLVSLTKTTADRIRDAIILGELGLGTKLSEQRLAEMLDVSRSPVRDALAILQSEGLVNVSPKRGSFVFTPELVDVDDLCEHRCVLETISLRKGISTNRESLVCNLERIHTKMEIAVKKSNAKGYTKGDIEFHNIIIKYGNNRSITSTYQRTIGPLMALRSHLFVNMNDTLNRSMDEHIKIIDACKRGKADVAVALVKEHIYHLGDAYRDALKPQ